jgi:putative restriction endonuclease
MKPWERDELILAINLYCKIPFGKIHVRNPDIIELAILLGRTPGSVSYKLANFASIDPSLDRKGAKNVSRLDKQVWNEFFEDWDAMAYESEKKMMAIRGDEVNVLYQNIPEGKTREAIVKSRVNQHFFRKMILASYNSKCCITGLPLEKLLVASHIIPWAKDPKNRLNPQNGLCLNALHDKAFDAGLLTIDESYRYGKSNTSDQGDYFKYCGQTFWEFISSDPHLYTDLIAPLGHTAKEKNDEFCHSYAQMINKFTQQFGAEYCEANGAINWKKLVEFNSSAGR